MVGDVEMNHTAPMMGQNHKHKEDSKAYRWYHEEIRRDQLPQVGVSRKVHHVWEGGFRGRCMYLATVA
jgi:hypothetical protein